MSFGGTVTRGRRGTRGDGTRLAGARAPASGTPASARDGEGEIDWERVAVFGTGIAFGVALGAGVALLFAPQSGAATRAAIARSGSRWAHQGRDAWEDLRVELQWAARRGKRRIGRRLQRARWAAEDFVDDRRRPARWKRERRREEKAKEPAEVEIDERSVQEIVDSMC
jgi:gas vesicle protein